MKNLLKVKGSADKNNNPSPEQIRKQSESCIDDLCDKLGYKIEFKVTRVAKKIDRDLHFRSIPVESHL